MKNKTKDLIAFIKKPISPLESELKNHLDSKEYNDFMNRTEEGLNRIYEKLRSVEELKKVSQNIARERHKENEKYINDAEVKAQSYKNRKEKDYENIPVIFNKRDENLLDINYKKNIQKISLKNDYQTIYFSSLDSLGRFTQSFDQEVFEEITITFTEPTTINHVDFELINADIKNITGIMENDLIAIKNKSVLENSIMVEKIILTIETIR